jgi:hypothetical protein
MNIRLIIDKLVVEGMTLSASERVALEEALRESITKAMNEKATTQAVPEVRNAWRERLQVSLFGNSGVAGLGKSLGASLCSHIWDGQASQSGGQGGKR